MASQIRKPSTSRLLTICLALSSMALSSPVFADASEGSSAGPSLELLGGYGLALVDHDLTSLNPYSIGFGAQLDYEFPFHLVLGIGGDYFLGESKNGVHARYAFAHARIGYDIGFPMLGSVMHLRPSLWVGQALGNLTPDPVRAPDGTANAVLVAVGTGVQYMLGDAGWYLGEDIRGSWPIGKHTKAGVVVLFTFGKRL